MFRVPPLLPSQRLLVVSSRSGASAADHIVSCLLSILDYFPLPSAPRESIDPSTAAGLIHLVSKYPFLDISFFLDCCYCFLCIKSLSRLDRQVLDGSSIRYGSHPCEGWRATADCIGIVRISNQTSLHYRRDHWEYQPKGELSPPPIASFCPSSFPPPPPLPRR